MILQALKEYYDRKAADPQAGMAPRGWEWRQVPFLVVIDDNGNVVDVQDTREGDGKAQRAKRFLVPSLGEKKGNGIKSNLLWENLEYMFGIPVPTKLKPVPDEERVTDQHTAFCARIGGLTGQGRVLRAAKSFVSRDRREEIRNHPKWQDILTLNQSLLLAMQGVGVVTDDEEVRAAVNNMEKLENSTGFCSVSGVPAELTRLEPPIKGVWGAQTVGANIVAVNNKNESGTNAGATPAFASYGKQQAYNSPVSKSVAFAYTTALNHLLERDSLQRMQIGDASTVFWSQRDTELERQFAIFFGDPPKDDPDRNTRAVQSLFRAPQSGSLGLEEGTKFYVLGLAPNASRISVRFWVVDTVASMSEKIRDHFRDITIAHGAGDRDALSLFRLLVSIAVQGKADNIPPNLAGDTMRSILEGLPYPHTLLQAAIRRIRAEHEVTYARAALIKACINRSTRFKDNNTQEELKVSLDDTNTNIGYRLGRLFAVLEKIQQDANPGINATIRDRFYGAASSTPVTVFGNLMRLVNHHLSKLEKEKRGLAVVRKQLLAEIMTAVSDFPTHLTLADQGRFAIGYYHQTQDLWTSKADKANKEEQQ